MASDLLERSGQLDALAAMLDAVAARSRGRLVLVTGEAGAGKTALVRRFADEHRAHGADPVGGVRRAVHAARAGPAARRRRGGRRRARAGRGGRRAAARGRGRAAARAGAPRAHDPRHRGPALGRRGDPRRPAPAGAARPTRRPRCVRRAPTATTSSTCATRCGSCSASWPGRGNIARCELPRLSPDAVATLAEPARHRRRRALPPHGRQPVLPLRGAGAPASATSRRRSATRSSPAPRA